MGGGVFSLSLFFPVFAEDSEASCLYPNNHPPKTGEGEKKILTLNSPWQAILSFFFFLERYFIGNTSSPSLETQAWGLGPVSEHQFEKMTSSEDFRLGDKKLPQLGEQAPVSWGWARHQPASHPALGRSSE